ncbi:MAG TPA: hypothetical protein VGS41_18580 [Chthonomonadales bacterium]|nr:hypothetical protein [Chthonomonadales bacterium]
MVALDVQETGAKKQTAENPGAEAIFNSMGGAKAGLPFYVWLSSRGKTIADSNALPGHKNIGYPAAPDELTAFEGLLRKTAPNMDPAARSSLMAYRQSVAPKQ